MGQKKLRFHSNPLREPPRTLHARTHPLIGEMVLTTKKCSRCEQTKDVSEFWRLHRVCIQCKKEQYAHRTEEEREHTRKLQRENRRKNKERDRERIRNYMREYMRVNERMIRYRRGDGCCLYCGETNPFMLNRHHIFGRKNSDFTITLCEDHHASFTRGIPFVLEDWYDPRTGKED